MHRVDEVRDWLGHELGELAVRFEVPGVSVAASIEGELATATAGVLNLRTGIETSPDALFMIQSVTKMWTATLIMQLIDDGLVQLDVPVHEYLPEFRTTDPAVSAGITVRQLLTHTGGFEGDIWTATTNGADALSRFVADLVPGAEQLSPPGSMYSYCNAGFGVLGRLVEVSRAVPYPEALRRHLADPLGISEIAFDAEEALGFRTAIGHVRPTSDAPLRPLQSWAVMPASNPAAGNQLAMSARALASFGALHLCDGRTPDGTRLLSVESAQLMRSRQTDHPVGWQAHGLGWFLDETVGAVEHGGDAPGVAAVLTLRPAHGLALAVLTNGGRAGDLIGTVLEKLTGDEPAPPIPTPTAELVAEPGRYLGRFGTRVGLSEIATDEGGRLWLTQTDQGEALTMAARAGYTPEPERREIRQLDGDTFVVIGSGGRANGQVRFLEKDVTGRARFLHASGRAQPRID